MLSILLSFFTLSFCSVFLVVLVVFFCPYALLDVPMAMAISIIEMSSVCVRFFILFYLSISRKKIDDANVPSKQFIDNVLTEDFVHSS